MTIAHIGISDLMAAANEVWLHRDARFSGVARAKGRPGTGKSIRIFCGRRPRCRNSVRGPASRGSGARSPWARRRKITLAELANEPWIFASNQVIRELIAKAFKACGLELPQESVSSSSILLRNHLLATGRFLTVLPISVLRYNSKLWSLKALPVDLAVKPRSVAILTLKNRTASPVVQLFVENVRAVAKTMSARSGSG